MWSCLCASISHSDGPFFLFYCYDIGPHTIKIGTMKTEAKQFPLNNFKHLMMTTLVEACSVMQCGETFKKFNSKRCCMLNG
jgi:hypothetical protein